MGVFVSSNLSAERLDVMLRVTFVAYAGVVSLPLISEAAVQKWTFEWTAFVALLLGTILLYAALPATPRATGVQIVVVALTTVWSLALATRGHDSAPGLVVGLVGWVLVTRLPIRLAAVLVSMCAAVYVAYSLVVSVRVGQRMDDAVVLMGTALPAGVFVHFLRRSVSRVEQARMATIEAEAASDIAEVDADARDRVTRLLHDDVVDLLLSIRDRALHEEEEVTRDKCAVLADRLDGDAVLEDGEAQEGTAIAQVSVLELAQRAAAASGLSVACEGSVALGLHPSQVPAIGRAAREAMRNVQRHAGVRDVTVTCRVEEQMGALAITDFGLGTDDVVPKTGMSRSIREPIEKLGGRVEFISTPGKGSTLTIYWPLGEGATPPASTRDRFSSKRFFSGRATLDQTRDHTMAAVGEYRLLALVVVVPALCSSLYLAVRHTSLSGWLGAEGLTVVVIVAMSAWLVTTIGSRALRWWELFSVSAIAAGCLALALAAAGSDALSSYDSWVVGLIAVPIAFTCFFQPAPWAALLITPAALVVLTHAAEIGLTNAGGAINAILTPPIGGFFFGVFLRWNHRTIRDQARQVSDANRRAHRRAASAAAGALELAHARNSVAPYLFAVAAGKASLDDAETRRMAGLLEEEMRDDLHVPGLLDPSLRQRVRAARQRGVEVRFDETRFTMASAAPMVRLLDRLLDSNWHLKRIVVSVDPNNLRLEVVPRMEAHERERVASAIEGTGLTIRDDTYATTFTASESA